MSITLDPNEISLIIPVKDNQDGVDKFLKHLWETQDADSLPKEIILVDNLSVPPLALSEGQENSPIPIRIINCSQKGPGAARNRGAKAALGKWLLFIDSDCVPTDESIRGYLHLTSEASAYIGRVDALEKDPISEYYFSQQIHRPPEVKDEQGRIKPKYLVTANFLIRKELFEAKSGFNEFFVFACEDMDLGLRLMQEKPLAFAENSVVRHDYHDGLRGFVRRFYAYGQGNRLIRTRHRVATFPLPFLPKDKSRLANFALAILQWFCLLIGYSVMHLRLLTGKQSRQAVKRHEFT